MKLSGKKRAEILSAIREQIMRLRDELGRAPLAGAHLDARIAGETVPLYRAVRRALGDTEDDGER